MATLKKIAVKAGVSVQTVSNVLNGRNQEQWVSTRERAERIRKIAELLKYRPHASARTMRNKCSQIIGVLLRNDLNSRFYYLAAHELILGINEGLESAGYVASIMRNSDIRDPKASRVFRERVLDGIIVVENSLVDVNQRIVELVPQCLWLECNRFEEQCCIRRNEEHTGSLLAESLLKLGYRRFVWMGANAYRKPGQHFSLADRFDSFQGVLAKWNIELDICEPSYEDKNTPHVDLHDIRDILAPDVVLVAYDTLIARRIGYLAGMHGLRIGRDFGLACCDETFEVAETWPELTRISYDRFDMGQKAAAMFLDLLNSSGKLTESRKIQGHFIDGTTAPGTGA